MSDVARKFHEAWLGMVQPSEGLVVSAPVLVDAQCLEKQDRTAQDALLAVTTLDATGRRTIAALPAFLDQVLGLASDRFDAADALPQALRLYVPEGKQELRPTLGLKRASPLPSKDGAELTPAAQAGRGHLALVWSVPSEVDLDEPEAVTGPWEYPAQAKFDRLLRECRVAIGLLTNGRELRLVYAPHGESSGWLSFRIDDMATVGGRPILDALVMLLGRARWFSVAEDVQLPALLALSRRQQSNVTNDLSRQVFEALEELLAGVSAAAERDPNRLLERALVEEAEGHVYSGLLTVLLRLVFVLYCEDRGLLPVESELYGKHYSLLGLYEELERDNGRYPDSMDRRYGAYSRLLALFRAIYLGVSHGDLELPPRQGDLFDPNSYPFLEGWGAGSAPVDPAALSELDVPSVSDGTVYRLLRQLILLGGQRLSYRALDVEQIGSVYEALMGFDVERVGPSGAVRIRLGSKRGAARVWVEPERLLEVAPGRRAAFLKDELGFDKNVASKLAAAVKDCKSPKEALLAMEPLSGKSPERAQPGALVVQPGLERRRTSSHYTPRSLSEPIVKKTLDPLLRAMGENPHSDDLLNLVICDPAMGSGAFLVAACRYLADHVVAAWTREAAEEVGALKGVTPGPRGGHKTKLELLNDAHEDVVNHARRLVAQRCLYGVDKNRYAVQLARLSLWLVTMAKHEPFTFVDHALRHGDSLVGLSFDQIRAFHWKAGHSGEQVETTSVALQQALDEAIGIRQAILHLAPDASYGAQRDKACLLADAQDAVKRVRLIADLVIGAFFAHDKDKEREKERIRRLDLVREWLSASSLEREGELQRELEGLQAELLKAQTPFHWMLEFPEVFYLERPDPLEGKRSNGSAMVEAFVGNPPFAGKNGISDAGGPQYLPWLQAVHDGAHGNADLSAHFFRRAADLVGKHGSIGLIATNTIGQGDTRGTGIQHLVGHGFTISAATPNLPWPGDAAVTVSVVHLVKGAPERGVSRTFSEQPVDAINSHLRPKPERPDPTKLSTNAALSFQGSIVLGMGFTLTPEERDTLIARDAKNAERIFAYLGGEEVNTHPTQSHDRYVISFGQMELAEAERWPDLLEIVREKVKPERDRNNRQNYRDFWWRFGEYRPGLFTAIAPLSRCLVTARTSKHTTFSFQPSNRVYSENLVVFSVDTYTAFTILSSRLRTLWVGYLASTLESRQGYRPSDCFETFPFPAEDPRATLPELEALGEKLYAARASYMVDTEQGLTKTYNALKDPACTDARILELRALHEALDRAVLRAYPKLPGVRSSAPDVVGWSDIAVPPFCIATDEDRAALQAFEDEVIDRLFVLNAERAKTEAALGRASKKGAKGAATKAGKKPRAEPGASASSRTKPKPAGRKGKKSDGGQGSLGW